MRAVVWHGPRDVRVDQVPEPQILDPGDAIVRITSTAICGSDLHLYNGLIPSMRAGDILGHEPMGEVVDVGSMVDRIGVGDRVVVPGTISCGRCPECREDRWGLCRNSNPNNAAMEAANGFPAAAVFGFSHLFGGYAGGQAEYLRVPYADIGCLVVPPDVPDEKVLLLSDILPTGWFAAEQCEIRGGDTVAVFGAGPVGQLAVRSAFLMGAEQVIAIDRLGDRLRMAEEAGAVTVDDREDVVEALKLLTAGRGPDACIDAVGMEGHGGGVLGMVDRVLQLARLELDRPTALRTAIRACRPGGRVVLAGAYAGTADLIPLGAIFGKGLTLTGGQVSVQRYLRPLLARVLQGDIDPEAVITQRLPLEAAPEAYRRYGSKEPGWIKVVLDPAA
jgi:threonine dehydrogenase-like Zn-dependent dehydrogenase